MIQDKRNTDLLNWEIVSVNPNDKNWKYLKNRYWELDVDQFNNSLIQISDDEFKKCYPYILTLDGNKLKLVLKNKLHGLTDYKVRVLT